MDFKGRVVQVCDMDHFEQEVSAASMCVGEHHLYVLVRDDEWINEHIIRCVMR